MSEVIVNSILAFLVSMMISLPIALMTVRR